LFLRAESLVHSPVHLLYLARSQEKLGLLVKARENYTKILHEKYGADAPDAFRQAQSSAQQEVSGLESRIGAVTVKVDGAKGPVAVTMDGEQVPPALIGLPLPVDPGNHTFQAIGTDLKSDPVTVSVSEGGREALTLTLKSAPGTLAPGAAAPASSTTPAAATPAATTPPPNTQSKSSDSGMKIGAYAALGVGVVGVGLGTVFLLKANSKKSDADDLCSAPAGCPLSKKSEVDALDNDYKTAGTISIVSYAVGGVGLITGVTLLVLSGGKHTENAAGVTPWIGYQSAGLSGRF
ncbi:MAG TPA: hypothetical protein VER04_15785, partial [Polyangiaceae bacterium]|nr:hypothetical protein [Polyangiaceae bacterium]